MNTIKFTQDSENGNLYWLSLNYSCKEDSRITVYYWCEQFTDVEGMPTHFEIKPELPSAATLKVKKGKNKSFKNEPDVCFDISNYEGMPLFNSSYKYYPCIISFEPARDSAVGDDGVSDYQNLLTYWVMKINKTTSLLQIAPIKQALISCEMIFLLQQIYGINDTLEDNKEQDELKMIAGEENGNLEDGQLCVIWITEEKNTVVMPCGHLCVCLEWAKQISKQTSTDWPVWRVPIKSFLPLNLKSIKKIENQSTLKASKSIKLKGNEGDYDYGFEVN